MKKSGISTINHFLRSLGVISKPGRGGARALPWVITRKGTIRLATIMKVPTALEAADVFVDVFDEVLTHERRQSELASAALDQERKVLENLEKKIDIVERLLEMHNKLEPNSIVEMVGQYITHPLKLGG